MCYIYYLSGTYKTFWVWDQDHAQTPDGSDFKSDLSGVLACFQATCVCQTLHTLIIQWLTKCLRSKSKPNIHIQTA